MHESFWDLTCKKFFEAFYFQYSDDFGKSGVGASCIFPLLGASYFGWKFIGSEVDMESLDYARKNVSLNPHLEHMISLIPGKCGTIFPAELEESILQKFPITSERESLLDFCMCNPPFFDKDESIKDNNPNREFAGTESELYCKGGEEGFVSKIFEESCLRPFQFRWYTSMLGKKSSLKTLRKLMFSKSVIFYFLSYF